MVVVASGPWPKHVSPTRVGELAGEKVCPENNDRMTARAVLICRPNSHPFQERTLTLDQPVKIGRSVARARPAANNAIFDCKVLSRNHALLWYENGKFYLQDTKSSNGTFVNNQRLSKGSEESPPREVCSADIVQFGVDVMENSRKVTHGCIVATLKLYLPDGKEAKASPSTSVVSSVGMVPLEDLYQLNQYLQEALQREHLLENKLAGLQRLVGSMRQASDEGWKALIDEDRLLSRVENLENQLQAYCKTFAEDKLREELRKLQEDKEQYQGAAKETLRKVLQEKLEAVQKLQDLERALSNSEDECNLLRDLCEKSQMDCKDLAQKYKLQQQRVEELTSKLQVPAQETEDHQSELFERLEEEKRELQSRLEEQLEGERSLQARLEALQADGDITQRQLTAVQVHLHELQSNNTHSKLNELNDSKQGDSENDLIMKKLDEDAPENLKEALQHSQEEVENMKDRLEFSKEELREGHTHIEALHSQLEESKLQLECKNAAVNRLQERIILLEIQLTEEGNDDIKDESQTIKDSSDFAKEETISKIKAEMAELEELLMEARADQQHAEEKVFQLRKELEDARLVCEEAVEETNHLRQQLQAACTEVGDKYPIMQLDRQMVCLVSSTQTMQSQMLTVQNRLIEEQQQNRRQVDELENIRKQLMESQQIAKQSRNEAAKMKDLLWSVQMELEERIQAGSALQEDNKKLEELSRYKHECESLQSWISVMEDEMRLLKISHSKMEEENKSLAIVRDDYENLRSKVMSQASLNELPCEDLNDSDVGKLDITSNHADLIQLKKMYTSCNQRKLELMADIEKLKKEIKDSKSHSYLELITCFLIFAFFVWGIFKEFFYYYTHYTPIAFHR